MTVEVAPAPSPESDPLPPADMIGGHFAFSRQRMGGTFRVGFLGGSGELGIQCFTLSKVDMHYGCCAAT